MLTDSLLRNLAKPVPNALSDLYKMLSEDHILPLTQFKSRHAFWLHEHVAFPAAISIIAQIQGEMKNTDCAAPAGVGKTPNNKGKSAAFIAGERSHSNLEGMKNQDA